MAIPSYQTLMLPVLRLIHEGKSSIPDCIPSLVAMFGLTEEEANELLPSGKQTTLANRAHWARSYMAQAGLLRTITRGSYEVTEAGKALLATNPTSISNDTLKGYPPFMEWKARSNLEEANLPTVQENASESSTPEAMIASAMATLEAALLSEIMSALHQVSPLRFERIVLDLLSAMGYGGGDLAKTHLTRATGDGGVDGIIYEDSLGLDAVYIQAKRYAEDSKIGRPTIQQFVGTLSGEGATKGVFVTTSDFSTEARNYLTKVQQRIVLINGKDMARLMIRYGVGVRNLTSVVIKGIDDDYFTDPNAV